MRHRPATGPELWIARAQGTHRAGGAQREEVYMLGRLRGVCRKRCLWPPNHRDEDGRWKTLDHHGDEEVDYQRNVSRFLTLH